jgi:hypothetical protein
LPVYLASFSWLPAVPIDEISLDERPPVRHVADALIHGRFLIEMWERFGYYGMARSWFFS